MNCPFELFLLVLDRNWMYGACCSPQPPIHESCNIRWTAENEERCPTNKQSFSDKNTGFLSGIFLHFRSIVVRYGSSLCQCICKVKSLLSDFIYCVWCHLYLSQKWVILSKLSYLSLVVEESQILELSQLLKWKSFPSSQPQNSLYFSCFLRSQYPISQNISPRFFDTDITQLLVLYMCFKFE